VYLVNSTIPAPKYMEDYENKTMVMKKFCPGHRDFLSFGPILRREDAMIEVCVGNALALIIDAKKMFEIGERVLAEDPLFFLCRNENCEHCGPYRVAKKEA